MPSEETQMNIENRISLLKFNLKNIREYISLADSKANITLTLLSLVVGIGLGASLISDTFEKGIQLTSINLWFLFIIIPFYLVMILYLLFSFLGINGVICVYKARLEIKEKDKKSTGDIYFKHVSDYPSFDKYYNGILQKTEENYEKDLADQVYTVSIILDEKMKKVNKSVKLLRVSLILFVILLLLSALIGVLA